MGKDSTNTYFKRTIDDTTTLGKRIEGMLEEVNQPIEIVLEQVRKETFQLLIPNNHSDKKNNKELTEQESEMYKLNNIISHPIERLRILPFAATNSQLLQMCQTNINITNIYKTPLLPGPASSHTTIYTTLKRVQEISVLSCGSNMSLQLCRSILTCARSSTNS